MNREIVDRMRPLSSSALETVFQSISIPVLILSPEYIMLAANEARLKATGTSREETLGRSVFEVFPDNPDDSVSEGSRNLKASLDRVLRERVADRMAIQKYDIPIAGSETGEFEARYWSPMNIPVIDNGEVSCIIHIAEDVTSAVVQNDRQTSMANEILARTEEVRVANLELKESKGELERRVSERTAELAQSEGAAHRLADSMRRQAMIYDALLSSSFDMLYLFDENLRLLYANPSQLKPWRKSLEDAVGKTFEEICETLPEVEKSEAAAITANFKRALKGEVVRFRSTYMPGGKRVVMESVTSPAFDQSGKIIGVTGATRDITEQVAFQTLLEQEREKLRAFAVDLQRATKEAERANELKSSFLANMSHEIRTPLAAILGFSRLLKERKLDQAESDRYIETIVRNGNSLTRIIDDILDLAKVEAGKLDVEEVSFSLYDLATDAVDLFKDKAKEKGIYLLLNIDEGVPSHLSSDPTRLRQILVNLIGNAIKFTDKGGVRVSVRGAALSENKIKISIDVKDTGIGLNSAQAEKLFSPFTQADNSTTRRFGGTGLGLALSQRLSRALAGFISITDYAPGKGCTFTLTFVADASDAYLPTHTTSSDVTHQASHSVAGMRVLIVDDSADNQFLVARLLTKNGATIETANDGEEGLSKALSGPYDVVLMDIQMPKMDGYQAKEQLDLKGYGKPVIALTAHAMSDERAKTKAAGFAAHLTKPLIPNELLETVASVK